jgi:putative ABC transport system permease protein
MIFKHLPFTLRRFTRHRLTTFLHIVGLTLGVTVCLLIGLFIRHELSFDAYHSKADRIYRVDQVWTDVGKKTYHYSTPFPLAEEIRKSVPGVETVTRIHHPFNSIVEINPLKRFKQDHVIMTDPDFLDVFDVQVTEGNAYETLRKPYQAILTQTTAKKFFGNEDAIGKVFKYNDKFNITVGAIVKDFPGNTHLTASMILSLADDESYLMTSKIHFGSVSGGSTFVVLAKGIKPNSGINAALKGIYDRVVNGKDGMPKDSRADMELQPLSDVHFNAKYAGGGQWVKAVNRSWLWFFGSIGLAVLALACINFVNLSTAQALTRAKEVGVRKTIGAGKFQLISQFLNEAFLLVLVAGILGVIIVKLSLPALNHLVDKQISFDLFHSAGLIIYLLVGLVITALLAGFYPAWLIAKFRPAATLKGGSVNSTSQSTVLRKGLVVTQFCISACLLMGVLLIGRQMTFMHRKDLGFNKDNILTVKMPNRAKETEKALFKTELSQVAGIKDLSLSTSPPSGDENTHWGTVMSAHGRDAKDRQSVVTIMTDENYPKLYNMQLKAGRFFTIQDTNSVSESLPEGQRYARSIVNENLVKAMGYQSDQAALGQRFWVGINGWSAEIVGVIADFNTGSLHETIQPTLITQFTPFTDKMNIKLQAGADIPMTINLISATYKKAFPNGIIEYNFLDQQLDDLYKTEARLYALFKIFSALAILISCLGLWGLVTFAAQQRTKEIGIRKVLGASISNIITLLTKDFLILVTIAIAIAVPLTYWGIHKWLQDFAFRISIGWSVFLIGGSVAILVALTTVSFQAIKAALRKPIGALRSE